MFVDCFLQLDETKFFYMQRDKSESILAKSVWNVANTRSSVLDLEYGLHAYCVPIRHVIAAISIVETTVLEKKLNISEYDLLSIL